MLFELERSTENWSTSEPASFERAQQSEPSRSIYIGTVSSKSSLLNRKANESMRRSLHDWPLDVLVKWKAPDAINVPGTFI